MEGGGDCEAELFLIRPVCACGGVQYVLLLAERQLKGFLPPVLLVRDGDAASRDGF